MPADPEYEAYHEGYRSIGADRARRGPYVGDALRASRNPQIARHAFAVALTLFREDDLDGFFAVLDGFLEGNPGSVPEEGTTRSHLELLGTSPFATRAPQRTVAERFLFWVRDRLQGSAHPALLVTAHTLMIACATGACFDLVTNVAETRYPDESTRTRVRQIYFEAVQKMMSDLTLGNPADAEALGKRTLARMGDDPGLQARVVESIRKQGRADEAFALGVEWLASRRGHVELLHATIEAGLEARKSKEAVALFGAHAPVPVAGWVYDNLVRMVSEAYLELGEAEGGAAELERIFGSTAARVGWRAAHLGSLHASAGNLPRALELAKIAIAGGVTREWMRGLAAFAALHEVSAEYRALVAPPVQDLEPFDDDDGPEEDA